MAKKEFVHWVNVAAKYAPIIYKDPCARFIRSMIPKIRVKPAANKNNNEIKRKHLITSKKSLSKNLNQIIKKNNFAKALLILSFLIPSRTVFFGFKNNSQHSKNSRLNGHKLRR